MINGSGREVGKNAPYVCAIAPKANAGVGGQLIVKGNRAVMDPYPRVIVSFIFLCGIPDHRVRPPAARAARGPQWQSIGDSS